MGKSIVTKLPPSASDEVKLLNPELYGQSEKPKRNKYGNKPVETDGIQFDSGAEHDRDDIAIARLVNRITTASKSER